jgi:uncharacterized protein (DUF433 family)
VILQIRKVAIPLTTTIEAYYIATKYSKLETRSRAFYPYLYIEQVINALEYATYYRVE